MRMNASCACTYNARVAMRTAMGTSIYDQVEIIETKECRFCSQVTDQRADRCPYCLVSQSTPSSPNSYSKVACALLVVVVGAPHISTKAHLT